MPQNHERVLDTIEKAKIDVVILDKKESEKYINMVIAKYVQSYAKGHSFLWDYFKYDINDVGFRDQDGLKHIGDYVKYQKEVYYFDNVDSVVFVVRGEDVAKLLDKISVSETYVSDKKGSFLLCYNHHGYLIGVGEATGWVERLKEELEK